MDERELIPTVEFFAQKSDRNSKTATAGGPTCCSCPTWEGLFGVKSANSRPAELIC
jgi:hypothetical protein